MKRIIIAVAIMTVMATGSAFAVPALQLEIVNGVYIGGSEETTFSTTNPFTLQTFLNLNQTNAPDLNGTYMLSMALVPKTTLPDYLGSFTFTYGGVSNTVNATSDMLFGTPPYETLVSTLSAGTDAKDLPSHGIFETYFYEFSFNFIGAGQATLYNVQTGEVASGKSMYFREFQFDLSGLNPSVQLHFDLYNTELANRSTMDLDINFFAPFSHDAQSAPVPEPGTMLLLGSGLVGLAGWGRKKFRK